MTNYLGGWIRHSGWYPDYKLKLYRRDHGKFVNVLHEAVKLDGPAGRLDGHLLHYTMRSYAEHQAKLDFLSTMAAEDMFARGRKSWRAAMIFAPPWTFLQRLVFQLGVLDGRRGWLIAWLSGNYIYSSTASWAGCSREKSLRTAPGQIPARPERAPSDCRPRPGLSRRTTSGAAALAGLARARPCTPELIAVRDSLLARRAKDAGISVHGVSPLAAGACTRLCRSAGWCAANAWISFMRMNLTR